ncbi:hypothetical protein [Streptomyces sp. NPDC056525]|uniref:hypothetical protein n=1 Tax=unclassified Streptomyces TaxID=2593676 RepID=UPI003673F32D
MHSVRHRRAAAATGVLTAALLTWLPAASGSAAAQTTPSVQAAQPAQTTRPAQTNQPAHSAQPRNGEPALGRILINPATADLKLPFDSVTDTAAERRMTDVAQNRLITRCMARYGITYVRQDPAPVTGPEDPHRYLFGLADPAFAATHGYDTTAGTPRPPRPEEPPLNDDGLTALYGHRPGDTLPMPDPLSEEEAQQTDTGIKVNGVSVPVHGCLGEGYRTLYFPTRTSIDALFPFMLSSEAHTRAKADSRMQRVFGLWSRCMARAGYPGIETPYEVTRKLDFGDDLDGPAAIAAAVRDVACKRKVNLVGFGAAIETAHQKRVASEVADDLAAYRSQRATRLALAATLP